MAAESPTIELPEGDPDAVADAAASLAGVGGAFDRVAVGVGRAVATVGSWEGRASVSFGTQVAGYRQVAGSVEGVLAQARGALVRYEGRLRDAREAIRRLRRDEEDCIARLTVEERRGEDAQGRASQARTRLSETTLNVGLDVTGFSLGRQAAAVEEIQGAEADVRRAERAVAAEREQLGRLRGKAREEREDLEEAEKSAAGAVRAAAGELPDVRLAGGAVSPPALAGTAFAPGLPQSGLLAGGPAPDDEDDDEDEGNALDGLEKTWGDVKGEVSGLAEGGFNHVNVFNGDKFKDTWSNDWDIAKNVAGDPLGAGKTALGETVKPLVDSYKDGGLDEAVGRSPSVLAGIVGLKGLNKLDNLDPSKPGDGDSGDGEGDGDGGDGGAAPPTRNGHLAGGTHPETGVPFKDNGFPDFSAHSKETVTVDGLTGKPKQDVMLTNREAGLTKTPPGYVWHHVEDGRTMQLVPKELHEKTGHTGGAARLRRGGVPADP